MAQMELCSPILEDLKPKEPTGAEKEKVVAWVKELAKNPDDEKVLLEMMGLTDEAHENAA